MSFEIRKRPFAIEPITGIMMPDGIFDAAIPQQRIGCYLTNMSDRFIDGLAVWVTQVSNAGFSVVSGIQSAANIAPGASILLEWNVSLASASSGEVQVTFGYNYWFSVGSHMAMVGSLVTPLEITKKVFVTETTFDESSKTYSCSVPEGTLHARLHGVIGPKALQKWKQAAHRRKAIFLGPILITDVELAVEPASPYTGVHGDLPFQDPWWKVVAWVVFVVALVAAFVAAVLGYGTAYIGLKGEDFVDLESGEPSCYNCEVDTFGGGFAMLSVAGVLSIVAMVALAVGLMDEADPFHRGQEATPPGSGEKTKGERVRAAFKYIDPPTPGSAYRMGIKWTYERQTDVKTYSHSVGETARNTHLLAAARVKVSRNSVKPGESFRIEARFYRTRRTKYRDDDLFVNALLRAPNGQAHLLRLRDTKGNGVYTATVTPIEVAALWSLKEDAIRGRWSVYVSAQDLNDAAEGLDPVAAAQHIGGYPIYTPFRLSIDGSEDCPHVADADVDVA